MELEGFASGVLRRGIAFIVPTGEICVLFQHIHFPMTVYVLGGEFADLLRQAVALAFLSYPMLRCSLRCVRTFGLWCVRTFDLPSDRTGHSQFRSNNFPEATVAYQSSLVPI